jgi:hypothetical protein
MPEPENSNSAAARVSRDRNQHFILLALAFAWVVVLVPIAVAERIAFNGDVRPANFFELVTSNGPVCSMALKSMNERHVFPVVQNGPDADRLTGKYLLDTNLQVNWRQVVGETGEYLDYASVQSNGGNSQIIYRFPETLGGQVWDVIGASATELENFESTETPSLISRKIARIMQARLSWWGPSMSSTPQWANKKDKPSHIGDPPLMFIDVVSVAGETYLLATSAYSAIEFYQHYVVLKDFRGQPRADVYLLRHSSNGTTPMICHFRNRIPR